MEIINQGKAVLMKADYEIEEQNEHKCEVCGCVFGFYEDECNIVMTGQTIPFFSRAFVRYEKRTINKEYHICCPNCQEEYIWNVRYPRIAFYREKEGTDDEWEEVGFLTGYHVYKDYLAWKKEELMIRRIVNDR